MYSAVSSRANTRVSDIAFCGLAIALMAVGAWVTVPLGPVPFTLQTFVMMLALLTLTPKQGVIAIVGYVLLGAVGVPVFAGMSGGIGVIMGPTGGFIWGWILGAVVAGLIRFGFDKAVAGKDQKQSAAKKLAVSIVAILAFQVILYSCGLFQLSLVASLSLPEAFAVGAAPFLIIDAAKSVAAIAIAGAVNAALGK